MSPKTIERLEVSMEELEEILERARVGALDQEDHRKLKAALETLGFLSLELESKDVSLKRLRGVLFGAPTEKLENVFPNVEKSEEDEGAENEAAEATDIDSPVPESEPTKKKRKGHGRNGADKYLGAEKTRIPHHSLEPGNACPKTACTGKVYRLPQPAVIVRVRGQAPLGAEVTELERLRCNLCGEVFTAEAPDGLGSKKYDETSAAMIALLKYGSGLPFNRLEKLEGNLGIPLPASTQWDIVNATATEIFLAYDELIRQAASGDVVHNDDTTAKILQWMGKRKEKALSSNEDRPDRTGIFTSGIVSTSLGRQIALFFTGRKHAGENLERVLAERVKALRLPIQMCDALSRNTSGDFQTVLANCLAHGRRQFVELAENFPDECLHVLETIGEVYRNDAQTKKDRLSPEERLRFHREHSRAVMVKLRLWFRELFQHKQIEPNSSLAQAICYMKKHWRKLTLFYRRAGAPLDNSICERALKKVIIHRKNALFFRSERGAQVGDIFMSLIYSAELEGENPFDYLTELGRHASELKQNPSEWMPWNYRDTLARLSPAPA